MTRTTHFSPENIVPGTRVGVYVVGARLGIGGGGVVYEARSPHGNLVALKISRYRPGVSGSRETLMDGRFWRGHMCQEQLHGHPNVLELYGHDRHPDPFDGWLYEVLELIPGAEPITDWVRRTKPSFRLMVQVFQRLAVTIGDMHWHGIRHRDIKPGNILVSPDGVPKLLDFNSATYATAKLLTKPAASALPGTAAYFAPEVCRAVLRERWSGQPKRFPYQPTGDLHALGVILYEILTGRHPFNLDLEGDELLMDIAHRLPARPSVLNSHVPRELEEIVMMLLAKDPERRYQSAYTVAAELEMLLNLSPEAVPSTPFEVPKGEWTNGHDTRTRTMVPGEPEAATVPDLLTPTLHPEPQPQAPGPLLVRVEIKPALETRPVLRRPRPRLTRLAAALLLAALALAAGLAAWTRWMANQRGAHVRVRPDGPDWLSRCSPEARATPAKLGLPLDGLRARVLEGDNVIYLSRGLELREGPIRAEAYLGQAQEAVLQGHARIGEDGASLIFDTISLGPAQPHQDAPIPAGTALPICAIAWDHESGVAGYPDSTQDGSLVVPRAPERHPGAVGLRTHLIGIQLAH